MNGVNNEKEEKKPLISEDKNGPPSNTEKNVNGSKRLLTVEPAMATYMVAVTAANPISQQYIYARFAEDYNYTASDGNISQCDTTESAQAADPVGQQVQAMASMWSILLIASDLLPSLVTTVILGAYSDKAGRKKGMIPTIVGLTIKCIFTLMVVTFRLPLPLMIVGTTIDGCLGGTFTMMMASLAYIADVTSLKQRPLRILAVEIFSGLGQTAASIGAGYLIKALGFTYPYLVILGIDLITLLYVLFWVKETVPKNPDAKLCSCSNFQKGIEVISKKTPDKRRWKLVASLFTFFLISMMDFGAVEIITFYVLNPPLCWNSVLIGYYNSFAYIVQTIGSLLFLKLFHRCLQEYGLVIISCLSGIGFYLLLAQSTTTLMVFMGKFRK